MHWTQRWAQRQAAEPNGRSLSSPLTNCVQNYVHRPDGSIVFSENTFTENARAAMAATPSYFQWWDKWKTLGLVVALGVFAFQVSKPRRFRRRVR